MTREEMGQGTQLMLTILFCGLFGLIALKLVHAWLIDQVIAGAECLVMLGSLVVAAMVTMLSLGTWFMPVPGVLTVIGFVAWWIRRVRGERHGEMDRWLETERRARVVMLKDPRALVGFEQLATALHHLGREAEEIDVLRDWLERDPSSSEARGRLRRLSAQDAALDVPPAEPPREAKPVKVVRDLGGGDSSSAGPS